MIRSIYTFKKHLFGIWKQRCERLILWEKSKNITTNDKRSNKLKFISNNSVIVTERELVFDNITGAPLHNSSTAVIPVNRQSYSHILSDALLNAHNWFWLVSYSGSRSNDEPCRKLGFILSFIKFQFLRVNFSITTDPIVMKFGAPLHNSSTAVIPVNRQSYSHILSDALLNAHNWFWLVSYSGSRSNDEPCRKLGFILSFKIKILTIENDSPEPKLSESLRYMNIYKKDITGKMVKYAVKKYKSHYSVPDTIYNKLNN
ncbi:hypothetical protein Glove_519g39 [Diversispora epigaea]|uniref:Uncharacterized protein n=1 Tax=Diversispora epigaea TaxID=1348612 RepID=A0A397GF05_9GLOM|nr:hypothetical protein Glove_519g39 [Diversispora epigaea]